MIDGCPPGLAISEAEFAHDLERRATGRSRHTPAAARDRRAIEILSGVHEGRTTGTPIALLIRNTDARSKDYSDIAAQFRPAHADTPTGRSTATATRAAAGAAARERPRCASPPA